ncbi:MAG: RNA polymerase factor sigma-54 [Bacteroidia bacterium]|nr:RNA polymerase factor sigma-54 [Bacteroidia bacterium]NNJ56827.1 RNA polymerase factor sigma-54 [Bacteroidia bacterium]
MIKQQLSQKLLQKLSPQQIQFIKLLQLNTLNFEERVEEELLENPAIESGKDESDENEGGFEESDDLDFGSKEEEFDVSDYMNDDDGGVHLSGDYSGDDEEKEFMPAVYHTSFRERLLEQLTSVMRTKEEEILAGQIVGTLDDDGYLRRPLSAIKNDLLFTQNIKTTPEELERILEMIHEMDPAGIGARDLKECLLLQIKRKQEVSNNPIYKLAFQIIDEAMNDFSKRHYQKMAKKFSVSEDYLKEALDFISKLNPKPAQSGSEGATNKDFIIPDFIVTESYGELEVRLNSKNAPELRVSQSYNETLKSYEASKEKTKAQKDAVQYIKQKLDSAKWFIDSVKQRQNTLLATMNKIVELQKDYFLSGDESDLKPMILKDIAEAIGMDISTISRVASSKYVETDFGILLLKNFFTEGITTDSGEEVSNREVKKILKDAVDDENKQKPLTDEALKKILQEKGYQIARRTVAKYREQLNIPVARLRKEL